MADTDDWGGVAVNAQPDTDDWGGVAVKPPKIPDMTGVQKTAQENLVANDNKEKPQDGIQTPQTPEQRLDVAAGMPVSGVLRGGDKDTPLPRDIRGHLVNAYANGTANDAGDFMQSAIHSIAPIAAKILNPIDTTKNFVSDVSGAYASMAKGGAAMVAYPFLSDENKQTLLENGTFGSELTVFKNPDAPTMQENVNRALELEHATLGTAIGALYAPGAAVVSPILSPILAETPNIAKEAGAPEGWAKMIPGAIGAGMDILGGAGIVHAAGELSTSRNAGKQFPSGEGPWDNHPGTEAIRQIVANATGKSPQQVSSSDIDQAIGGAYKDKAPSAKDFEDVAAVTGTNVKTLHIVFKETGVHPDQVFEDSKSNPQIAVDVAAGKVPEAYEHLVGPPKPVAEKLTISQDEATRSFTVTDADGDHVQSGFDSAEEAKHYIEDRQFESQEKAAKESKNPNIETEQSAIPGTERITDKALAERNMEGKKQSEAVQKPADEGLFDVAGRGQHDLLDLINKENADEKLPVTGSPAGEVGGVPERDEGNNSQNGESVSADRNGGKASSQPSLRKSSVPPAEIGKPTSLHTLIRKNGGIKDEGGNLSSMGEKSLIRKNGMDWDEATELAQQHGYFHERPSVPELQNALLESNGGREHFRDQDIERNLKAADKKTEIKENDPVYVEHYADSLGLDAEQRPDETDRQYVSRLKEAIRDFYKNEAGVVKSDIYRRAVGAVINVVEKFTGKLTGGIFEKLGDGYIRTFQPELMGDKALRADAYLAKYKASGQEAENAYFRQHMQAIKAFDKLTPDQRMQWLYDHETGRWNERDNPDHARFQSLLDATFKAEKAAIGADATQGYKENYLPHAWENPEEVQKYFNSDAFIKKYGKDGFTKRSTFQLIQDGVRAGFKLKTDNPESMLLNRLLDGQSMVRTMDLLRDMESSGLAKRATIFSVDKKIAKTQAAIEELQEKYKKEFEKKNDPRQSTTEGLPAAESKAMQLVEKRLNDLKARLDSFNAEKADNKLTPEQMKELKGGFRVIGPDSKVWNIHQQVGPVWKNAMEMKGLWENQGATGDFYRSYMQGKAIWTQLKLGLSLFHPVHVAMINLASGMAGMADHLIQGGKLSDLALKDTGVFMGITGETFKGRDHPAVQAWKTAPEMRTPEQQQMVFRMTEGGFKPTMSARDTVHFKENFDKAISGVGLNNLRLIGTAISLPGLIMKPFFEHWIPGMKSEIYLRRYQDAIDRDPSLANDAGRRGEMARQISKDTDRTYGEMNNDVQFWNRNVRDAFNAAFISGGWKLAQIYNAQGLLHPGKIAYNFAKTGEFSKQDVTYNMLHAYAYTGLTLALGGAINAMLGNPIGAAKDTAWDMVKNLVAPQTGEKNPDGTPIRINQPAFAKEAYSLAHEINTKGIMGGAGSFLYHQTLVPGIVDTLRNRDFTGREVISDPTDLHQWMNAGWNTISPISIAQYDKAEAKNSDVGKIAGVLGFPTAGAYINQTPFEQKVLHIYSEQNPPKGDVYSVQLKADLKSAIAKNDRTEQAKIEQRMKEEGMTTQQISYAKKPYTDKFVDTAWKKLSAVDQKRLIESASEEEKKKFKVKSE